MIEIYSKKNCSYCAHARDFLRNNQIAFTEHKLDEDFTKQILQERYPTAKTYPVIIIDGMYIGGFANLKEHLSVKDNRKLLFEG